MRIFFASLFSLCFFTSYISSAQEFGGNPASVKWKQINTDTVRVIFPSGLDSIAQRIATLTNYEQRTNAQTIGNKIRKVSIVVQDDVTFSNGLVQLAPYRSEFFLMPSVNAFELGAQNWADNLAIHEFRHVQQYSNFREGLSKVMYDLFGEDGQEIADDAAIPNWFFEGDAVYNETLLSHQGRGRLPSFLSSYRSMYDAGKNYNYMKLRNGSLKSYVPDHYPLGYMLVAYGREKYGMDFWRKVTSDAVRFKPLFYPLQGAVEKYAGIPFNDFVKNAFAFYDKNWEADKLQKINWLTSTQKNNVVDYKYPYTTEDGGLIVLKDSYRDIPTLYKINTDKTETKIAVRDITYDDYFSYNDGKAVVGSLQTDLRWGNREYSVIKLVDINSGKEKKITTHTRYFTPDISHDGKLIAAVVIKPNQHCDVDILNINGTKIKSLISNSNLIYTYPKFSVDDQSLFIVVRNKAGEMSLQKINIGDENVKTLLPFANRIIGFPVIKKDTVLYSCSNNGNDEIWAYASSENKNYRLANYSTGLYQATFSNNKIIASAFTANGYRLAAFAPQWQETNIDDTLANLYVLKVFDSSKNNTLQKVGVNQYKVSTYHKFYHPFNFHGLRPNYIEPDISAIIYGENVLNTLQSQLYYTYNRDEHYNQVGYSGAYGAWYVQPVIGVSETFQRNELLDNNTNIFWNEFNADAGLQLPLDISNGKQYRNILLSATDNVDYVQWTGIAKNVIPNLNFNYIQTSISYTGQIQQAVQQIYPHWAQSFFVQYRTIDSKYTANQFLATGSIYLPGIFKSNSLVLNGAYQSRDTANQYSFTNDFPFSRGYLVVDYPRMFEFGVNYHFPLCLPDWGFGNIVYFQRIRANAYFDYTNAKSLIMRNQYQFRSTGVEIYFDTKWWNQEPVTFGIRYSRLLDNGFTGQSPNQWQIVLPINLVN
jgi:hypothetical protein